MVGATQLLVGTVSFIKSTLGKVFLLAQNILMLNNRTLHLITGITRYFVSTVHLITIQLLKHNNAITAKVPVRGTMAVSLYVRYGVDNHFAYVMARLSKQKQANHY